MRDVKPIRVMIVDDHTVMREGLELLLSTYDDFQVVATAGDGERAIALCAQAEPDVVIMDLAIPGMDGPTIIQHLHEYNPEIQFIALTSFLEEDLIQRALQAGAISYLLKSVSTNRLAEAIRNAVEGESTLDASAAQLLIKAVGKPPPLGHDLTEREREVLSLMVLGKTNQAISDRLNLSHGTVRVYVSHILEKLGATNRTEAVSMALQHNIVS